MDINKEELAEKFAQGDLLYVFREAERISDFVLVQNFKIYNKEEREDMKQECLLNLWKKVQQGKVKQNKNLFAFIWKNTQFRILEILRKQKRRNEIATFTSYENIEDASFTTDFLDSISEMGDKYRSEMIKELSTV